MLRQECFIRACYSIVNLDLNQQIRQVNQPHLILLRVLAHISFGSKHHSKGKSFFSNNCLGTLIHYRMRCTLLHIGRGVKGNLTSQNGTETHAQKVCTHARQKIASQISSCLHCLSSTSLKNLFLHKVAKSLF
jgi:hypothetical protein